jgi:TolB protein
MLRYLLLFCTFAYGDEPYLQNIRQLTHGGMGFEKSGEAYFSPDEKSIIFQAVPAGHENYQIYVMDLDQGVPLLVSTGCGKCTCGYFRPDGKKIIFASSHEAEDLRQEEKNADKYTWDLTPYMNIYEANPDGSDLVPLTHGPAYHAECAYSSDGKEIVFASNESGSMNLYVMQVDGSEVRQITHNTDCYNGGPFFSPDDTEIIFRADRQKKDYLQIYKIDRSGHVEQITDNEAVNWAPYWHPNGKVVAFTTSLHGHRQYEIYLIHIDTKRQIRLTCSPSFDGLPVFNKAGDKIMWTSKRGAENACHIFIADFSLPNLSEESI